MLRLEARAKVNLGLAVVAKRGDGFHELDTLFARLELHDALTLEPVPEGVSLTVTGAALPTGEGNLAYRAARLYLEAAGLPGGVRLGLEKRIPVAAGLGGGSSDAAAVLRGLARLYPTSLELPRLALQLGSDVPFFVQDLSAARATGRGERLSPVAVPRLELVLANPGLPVSAREAYENLQNFSPRLELEALLARLENGGEPGYPNALQPGVTLLYPEIREALAALRAAGLRGVLMSGSGATCFGLAASRAEAEQAAAQVQRAHPDWWVEATATG